MPAPPEKVADPQAGLGDFEWSSAPPGGDRSPAFGGSVCGLSTIQGRRVRPGPPVNEERTVSARTAGCLDRDARSGRHGDRGSGGAGTAMRARTDHAHRARGRVTRRYSNGPA